MEEPLDNSVKRHSLYRLLKKIIGSFAMAAVIFVAGVATGRGNIQVGSLSQGRPSDAAGAFDYSSVNQLYNILKTDFDGTLDKTTLTNGLKRGLVSATGDPYTQFFDPKEAKQFNDQLSGSIIGIGAELGTRDGSIVIVSPLAGYPAEKAGLKSQDIIVGVDGKVTTGMSVDNVVSKIRGKENTQVTLTVVRGAGNPFNVTITRQKITVPSVKWQVDGSIGYLKITQFTEETFKLAQQAVQDFKYKSVKGIVLDMRGNPGGYLTSAVNLSSLWLDQGKVIVQERRGNTVTGTEVATGNNPLKGMPTVVLIDSGSASASEITAGALRDNGAATLVGQKSFGKGSVQQVENLGDGSEVKITIARWYTPSGKNIDKQGITPDVAIENDTPSVNAGKDPQKDKAYTLLQQKL